MRVPAPRVAAADIGRRVDPRAEPGPELFDRRHRRGPPALNRTAGTGVRQSPRPTETRSDNAVYVRLNLSVSIVQAVAARRRSRNSSRAGLSWPPCSRSARSRPIRRGDVLGSPPGRSMCPAGWIGPAPTTRASPPRSPRPARDQAPGPVAGDRWGGEPGFWEKPTG
jgi:hypothetical protein